MPKVRNAKDGKFDSAAVYVGRPSKFGNPYIIGRDGSRDEVVAKFADRLRKDSRLTAACKAELKDKDLVCWCAPLACHADVLLKVANE